MAIASQYVPFPPPPRTNKWPPDPDYYNELNRWFETIGRFLGGVTYLRANGLYFPDVGSFGSLPTSGYGLKPGEVFSNNGVLTVVLMGDIWAGSFSATTGLGDLTVTIT